MLRRSLAWVAAAVAAPATVGITVAVNEVLDRGIFLIPVVTTAAISVLLGTGPASLTLALVAVLTAWYVLPPIGSPVITATDDRVLILLFLSCGAIVLAMGEALRRGWRRAHERQRTLEQSEAFYRSLIENSTDLTSLIAADGTSVFVGPAAERLLGYTAEERLGRNVLDIVHPEDHEIVRRALTDVVTGTRENQPMQFRILRKDGQWRWIESIARNMLDDPGVRAIVVNSRDVTERHAADARIRFQAHLLDAVGQAVIGTDHAARVLYMNRTAEALSGWTKDEAAGRSIVDLIPEHEPRPGSEVSTPAEFRLRRRDGTDVPVLINESVLVDAAGQPDGAVLVLLDLSERLRAEARLREEEDKLQQVRKLEAIGRLAGGVAHDFNNLLTGIRGFAQFAHEALPVDSAVRTDLEEIQRSADRAASLTRQLLAFGRKQVLRPRVLDLNTVVADTNRLLHRLIGEDIRITTRLATGLGFVKADPGQIEQIIVNLALNARDAMPTGGELIVETANAMLTEADSIYDVFDVRPGAYVQLTVTDTGHGMDGVTLERVFEPFFTTKPTGHGTGLGLSTVYGIVKQSGGYIWIDSAPAEGARVRIYLPRVDGPVPAPADLPREVPVARGSETVLLVEDDDTVRALTRRVLQRQGYEVLEARNGIEALRLAEPASQVIDLVISDIVMPELGGRQLVERLRSIRPEVPVLLMSGYTDDAIVRHGITEATAMFLPKPFTTEALANKVRAVLDTKGN